MTDAATGGHASPSPCCAVSRQAAESSADRGAIPHGAFSTQRQVLVRGGRFTMGDHHDEGYEADGESPTHAVEVHPFWIDATAVTNAQFGKFVRATGYRTDAEGFGSSAVFHSAVAADRGDIRGRAAGAPWWLEVRGADWRHPEGPQSDIAARQHHPVVHVSHRDASAYARWAGKRLPTEAEWEFAARGGIEGARFPWGDTLVPRGRWLCNIWQGDFPTTNTCDDGFATTAPAKSFFESPDGVWQMVGNVWEWVADWFSAGEYAARAGAVPVVDPRGPHAGDARVMRGGSYLCHDSYCYRYRVAARSSNTPESSSSNIGFRCANDGPVTGP